MRAILISILVFSGFIVSAQTAADAVKSRHFIFIATSMSGTRGFQMLNSPYDVTVKGDSVISYLPYAGNAMSATIPGGPDKDLKFTSMQSETKIKENRKGTEVEILLSDQNAAKYSFFISKNGTATLDVMSGTKDPVSYRGYVKALR